jgi:arylsulfatase A-like enzyme
VEKINTEEQLLRLKNLYVDMIYYNDHHLGLLIEKLDDLGLFQDCLFILTSDHGEAFGEHGFKGHGNPPYEEQIRVPLIIKFPHSEFRGQKHELIQHIDVVPTLLDYLGKEQDNRFMQGRSVLSMIKQGQAVNDFVFAETQLRRNSPRYTSMRTKEFKYIEAQLWRLTFKMSIQEIRSWAGCLMNRPRFLYRLKEDESEKVNLIEAEKKGAARFHSMVRGMNRKNRELSRDVERGKTPKIEIEEDVAQQLEALGYFER